MALKGKPIAVGTTDTDLYTCPSTIEASVHGLVFANGTGSSATITVKVYVQSTAATTTIITGQAVAANTAFTWPKPINLNAGDKIIASASTGSAIVCLYSAYEGSAAPVAVGFTPRGAWSSGASYVTNDVVSYTNGSSYLAIQASTNQQPDTQTAYWLLLAAKGDTGSGDVTGQASSVDNEIALFSGTGGKTIKRASTTGILKGTSGVLSAATAGTDYVAPGGALGTPSSGALTNCTADGTNSVGYRNVPQSGSDKTTSYSLATTDIGEFVGVGTSGSITIPNSTFAAGDIVSIFNNTTGNITITCSITTAYIAGTNTDKDTMTLATRGVATILFISGTVCVVTGNVT
jgi:hypothetical protein